MHYSGICRTLFGLISFFIFAGCSGPPKQFPIGLYAVWEEEDLPELASAGFNHVLGKPNRAFLDTAQTMGVSVFAEPNTRIPNFRPSAAKRAVKELDRHPALRGWYIADEPDLWNISPKEVQDVHRQLKQYGATKPTVVVLGTGSSADDYGLLGDIVMFDRYPVNTRPLAAFGQHFRDVRLARGAKQPLYAVVQAFNWRYYTNRVSGNAEKLRPPSEQEIRCMSYMALVHGANGLFYYCWNDGKWIMGEHPETWEALQNVVAEVNERAALFQGKRLWSREEVKYLTGRKLNEVGEPSLALAYVEVSKPGISITSGRYLVVVNTTSQEITTRLALPDKPTRPVGVVGEEREVSPDSNAHIIDSFAPYTVHVYGPITCRDNGRGRALEALCPSN